MVAANQNKHPRRASKLNELPHLECLNKTTRARSSEQEEVEKSRPLVDHALGLLLKRQEREKEAMLGERYSTKIMDKGNTQKEEEECEE